ncbi:hypothetical protein [Streptomyces nanshensis]|uniref:Uncharacterized protein n=1 Tax=Streptomyces nanshensis TaxID=518642 RepID=A0A1E7L2Y6_9ACTN|nr:hypothetical protein [Streptomyces nanshensis]OEV10556.1 hypothetical protein AN218_17005 [Streptomyces nanshensis]
MPLVSIDALGTLWFPLAVGVLIAMSPTVEQGRTGKDVPGGKFLLRPVRCVLLSAPFAWQITNHASDHLAGRLFGECLVLGVGVALGLLLLSALSVLARLLRRG